MVCICLNFWKNHQLTVEWCSLKVKLWKKINYFLFLPFFSKQIYIYICSVFILRVKLNGNLDYCLRYHSWFLSINRKHLFLRKLNSVQLTKVSDIYVLCISENKNGFLQLQNISGATTTHTSTSRMSIWKKKPSGHCTRLLI